LKPEIAAIAAARLVLGEIDLLDWRCGESLPGCDKAATTFRRLTFFAGS
jgi:hypothetical protein